MHLTLKSYFGSGNDFMTGLGHVEQQSKLRNILCEILVEGEYEAALLSDADGLSLAAVGTEEMADMMAAVTALLRDAATHARQRLALAHVNELSLVGDDRFRLVCRFFDTHAGQPLCLTLVVPPDQAYRRITNQAIKKLRSIWAAS